MLTRPVWRTRAQIALKKQSEREDQDQTVVEAKVELGPGYDNC